MFSLLGTYVRQSFDSSRERDVSFLHLLSLLPRWRLNLSASPLHKETPWITYDAADFLETTLRGGKMRVFEYGSGGSTLFFAKRAAEVVSVEHNPSWSESVCNALAAERIQNVQRFLVPPSTFGATSETDVTNPSLPLSSDFPGCTLESYVSVIDTFPAEHFDLVLVDGRARPACVTRAMPKIKRGGWLMLDNAERPAYQNARDLLHCEDWTEREFYGPGPIVSYFWLSAAWQKRVK